MFDAAGVENCSGTPKTCAPLWNSDRDVFAFADGAIVSANGVIYAPDRSQQLLYAFDAAGAQNCSGTPKTCAPIWSAEAGGAPTVSGGLVYSSQVLEVRAFDAAGVRGCSGSPKTCAPLWRSRPHGSFESSTPPTVAGGLVFYGRNHGDEMFLDGDLVAFDAAGVAGCSGTPRVCDPIWFAPSDAVTTPVAVAGGTIYVVDQFFDNFAGVARRTFRAFDIAACGTGIGCTELWSSSRSFGSLHPPAVANGVVYVNGTRAIDAYDAGSSGCTGLPTVCSPIATFGTAVTLSSSSVVALGMVYFTTEDNVVHALTVSEAHS